MPNALKKTDPHLVGAVSRLRKTLVFWGGLLLVDSIFTGLVLRGSYPLAPLSGIAAGVLSLFSGQPLVLALVAAQMAATILRIAYPVGHALGSDPILILADSSLVTAAAVAFTRAIFFYTAAQQFLHYRLLYGTERATGPVAEMPAIPEMIPNRTGPFARWALWSGISSILAGLASFGFPGYALQALAVGLAGSLAVLAVGLGLGVAFSPTDRRGMALAGTLTGIAGFVFAVLVGNFLFVG